MACPPCARRWPCCPTSCSSTSACPAKAGWRRPELADAWPQGCALSRPLVFVTAYDQYAVQAFEAQAVDYLLKPVQPERLRKTCPGCARRWRSAAPPGRRSKPWPSCASWPRRPAGQTADGRAADDLQASQRQPDSHGGAGRSAVLEAADKYLRVLTARQEYLIRTLPQELVAQLDPAVVLAGALRHPGACATAIASAERDEAGRMYLHLRDRPEWLAVSRLYAPLFKAM